MPVHAFNRSLTRGSAVLLYCSLLGIGAAAALCRCALLLMLLLV